MNRHLAALAASMALLLGTSTQAGTVTPELQDALAERGGSEEVPVIVRFTDSLNLGSLRRKVEQSLRQQYPDPKERNAVRQAVKRAMLVEKLRQQAGPPMQIVQAFLQQRGQAPSLKSLWAINAVASRVPAHLIEDLADLPGVESVTLDAVVQGPVPSAAPTAPTNWNLDAVGAPELWQLGHTGLGVVVATLDTGADGSHPDLIPRWRGGNNSWFDPYGQHGTPGDVHGHGTGTLGLMVAGAAGGFQIGMAPDAQWIAAKIFDNSNQGTLSGIHQAFQWTLDPDGNPATDDLPDIVNNSWVLSGTINQCYQEFAVDVALLKAADVAVVFAGGNYGPGSNTSVSPSNDPVVFSVGSVNDRNKVSGFSGRGAGACDGGTYPHLTAPGDSVLTLDLTPGFYNVMSGTSFAAPHVAGGMALLKGAFPQATATQLESALVNTALDLGSEGPDDDYGHGLLDVVDAYNWLAANLGGGAPGSLQLSASTYSVDENVANLTVTVTRSGGSSGEVSVDYATGDGSAAAGEDYQATSGTLSFLDGETSQGFTVPILDDGLYEGDEDFSVTLSNPQGGASLGTPQSALATILDDDPAPQSGTLEFISPSYTVAENGVQVELTVVRTGGSDGTVTVDYTTADGTATAGADYTGANATLTFLDGQTNNSFTVTVLDDSVDEADEGFSATLSNPGGGASLGNPSGAAVTITDNDSPSGPTDNDGDSFAVDIDCNDGDPSVYPGASEIKHDGIDQDCNGYDLTIVIVKAEYNSKRDKLSVEATSALGASAGLVLDGYGPMKWSRKKAKWSISVRNVGGNPGSVTVSGVEGSESAP